MLTNTQDGRKLQHMNQITAADARTIHAALDAAINGVLAQHGLEKSSGKVRYCPTSLTYTLAAAIAVDPTTATEFINGVNPNTPAAIAYTSHGNLYGINPGRLGTVFGSNGRLFAFSGIAFNRPKFPINGRCMTSGKEYKFPATVAVLINDAQQPGTAN